MPVWKDVREIGHCRLYHGDSSDIIPALSKVDLIVTDPPYGINVMLPKRKTAPTPDLIAGDAEVDTKHIPMMMKRLKKNGAIYCFTRLDVAHEWVIAIQDSGGKIKTPIVWDKGVHAAGDCAGDYGNRVEIVIYATKGRHLLRGKRDQNYWKCPRPPMCIHPTPKPVEIMARAIQNSSDVDDIVLDPFMGTGATGVAAGCTGRRFIGIELEKKYFDKACARIEQAYEQPGLFEKPSQPAPEIQEQFLLA